MGKRKGKGLGFPKFKKHGKRSEWFSYGAYALRAVDRDASQARDGPRAPEPVLKLSREDRGRRGADLVGHEVYAEGAALVRARTPSR